MKEIAKCIICTGDCEMDGLIDEVNKINRSLIGGDQVTDLLNLIAHSTSRNLTWMIRESVINLLLFNNIHDGIQYPRQRGDQERFKSICCSRYSTQRH